MFKACYNDLGMIYQISKLPSKKKDKVFEFALGSNNGVGIMSFSSEMAKKGKEMCMKGPKQGLVKTYLEGKVINNMIAAGSVILAFEHISKNYYLIKHDVGIFGGSSQVEIKQWP